MTVDMSPKLPQDYFSSTTPPSDLDDYDLTTLLACSRTLPKMDFLTPLSTHQAYSSPAQSDSNYQSREDEMAFQGNEAYQDTYFSHSSNLPYYPFSSMQDALSYPPGENYSKFDDQLPWMSVSEYSQHPPSLVSFTDGPPLSVFPAFDTALPSLSGASINVPAPQSVDSSMPSSFNFNTVPTNRPLTSESYLTNSPAAFSQARSSQAESISSSLSRSTSPSPSLFQQSRAPRTRSNTNLSSTSNLSASQSLHAYGILVNGPSGSSPEHPGDAPVWRCAYPGCTSRAVFTRGCDLRKHFHRHSKHIFCRVEGCPQSAPAPTAEGSGASDAGAMGGGFSSKKDRARHEAKHNPGIRCEWRGPAGEECERVFSRMDNMRDHVRRIHRKGSQ